MITPLLYAQEKNLDKFYKFFMYNEYDSARVFLQRKLQESPDNPQFRYYLGKTYFALKQPAKSIQELVKALSDKPSDAKIHDLIGRAYEEQGMTSEAIEAYTSAIRWNPLNHPIQLKLGSLYYKQQNYDASIAVLKNVISKDSTLMQAYYLMGRSYIKKTEFDSAISVSTQAVALDSVHFPNLLNLGVAYFNLDMFDEAVKILEHAIQLSPRSNEARYFLGQTYYHLDEKFNAINQLETRASTSSAYRLRALKTLVMITYYLEDTQKCISTAEEYLSIKTNEYLSFVHYYLARALSDEGRHGEADEEFKKTVKLSNLPFINSTYFFRGLNYYYQKNYPRAIVLYKKALTLDPKFGYALYNLAIAYDDYYKDKQPAIRYYEKFLQLSQNTEQYPDMVKAAKQRLTKLKEQAFLSEYK